MKTLYIEPGTPWENGYAESFFSRLRDELLNCDWFESQAEARVFSKRWQADYNKERPHRSFGYPTPSEFASQGGYFRYGSASAPPPCETNTLIRFLNRTLITLDQLLGAPHANGGSIDHVVSYRKSFINLRYLWKQFDRVLALAKHYIRIACTCYAARAGVRRQRIGVKMK